MFERLGKSTTSLINANTDTLKNSRQYQLGSDQSNNKRPKYDANYRQSDESKSQQDSHSVKYNQRKDLYGDRSYTKGQHNNQAYNQQSKQSKYQTQDKIDKIIKQSKYPETNKEYDDRHNNHGYYQERNRDRYGHQDQNKHSNNTRESERHGREWSGNAHNRDTSRENQHSRRENRVPNTQVYNKQIPQNTQASEYSNNKSYHQGTYEPRKRADIEQQQPSGNRSSIKITSIDDRDKQSKSLMNLDIERRPLSPLNKP